MQYIIPTVESAHRFPTRHGADLDAPRHCLALFQRNVVLVLGISTTFSHQLNHALGNNYYPLLKDIFDG